MLIADPRYAPSDHAAGLRLAVVSVLWSKWEPTEDHFSAAYRSQVQASVATFRRAGMTIGINLGLNDPPAWVLKLTGGQLKDQYGTRSGTANLEFNLFVRSVAAAYIADVVRSVGVVSYYTIGFANSGEAVYPARPAGQSNAFWAFNDTAQGKTNGLPSELRPTPLRGWVPGTATYAGKAVTTAQVQAWYTWYLGALINTVQWEIGAIRAAGFVGYVMVKLVGNGANPWVYAQRIADHLKPESYDSWGTLNGGAVYQQVLAQLPSSGLVVDITSVGDGSGSPANNACRSGDSSVNYQTSSAVDYWSSTRWLTYLAGRRGIPVVGESTGQNTSAQMASDLSLSRSCHMIGLMWAFDYELYGGHYASIASYAENLGAAVRPNASVSPPSRGFMTRKAGQVSYPTTFTLTNTGTSALTVSKVTLNGSQFRLSSNTCGGRTLAPAAQCGVAVEFAPKVDGAAMGSVTFSDNAPSGAQTVTFSGTARD